MSKAFIAPPAEFVAAALGGSDEVEGAVAVDVGGDDHIGIGPAVFEELYIPGTAGGAAVFEVGDTAGIDRYSAQPNSNFANRLDFRFPFWQ